MREDGGYAVILAAIEKLSSKHKEHIDVYGTDNHVMDGSWARV
jgi:glutamine synthetase